MGHHAGQAAAQTGGEFEQEVAVGMHPAALLAAVDFDQGAWRRRLAGDRAGHRRVVGDHDDLRAGGVQLAHLLQLLRRDADRVEDVRDAVAEKIFRLGQGGDGDAAWLAGERQARDLDRLGGLHVRAQRHIEARQGSGHRADVTLQDGAVEHQAGCRQVGELHAADIPAGGVRSAVRSTGPRGEG